MRPTMIVIIAPIIQHRSHMLERYELCDVQALVAQTAVEGLDEAVLRWLPRTDDVQLHAPLITPLIERSGGEFRSVADGYRVR